MAATSIQEKMIVLKKVTLQQFATSTGVPKYGNAIAARKEGVWIRFDYADETAIAGPITTTKKPFSMVPLASIAALFPTIFAAFGIQGVQAVTIVGTDIIFEGSEVAYA